MSEVGLWLLSALQALPAIVNGFSAYRDRHAELMTLRRPGYAATVAEDDAEIDREKGLNTVSPGKAPTGPVAPSTQPRPPK